MISGKIYRVDISFIIKWLIYILIAIWSIHIYPIITKVTHIISLPLPKWNFLFLIIIMYLIFFSHKLYLDIYTTTIIKVRKLIFIFYFYLNHVFDLLSHKLYLDLFDCCYWFFFLILFFFRCKNKRNKKEKIWIKKN